MPSTANTAIGPVDPVEPAERAPKTTGRAAAPQLPDSVREGLDAAIRDVRAGALTWSHLTLAQRARLMERLRRTIARTVDDWADIAATSKGLPPGHPLRGEEWLAGPYAALVAVDAYRDTLRKLAHAASPLQDVRTDQWQGRLRAHVFPLSAVDGLLLSGYTGEVWFEPGVTDAEARSHAGLAQLSPGESGGVGLVLGAGNITSIPVLDVLYELLAHNRTAVLKVNPTQDALVPVFARAFAPLIEFGFLRIVQGAGDVGAYLTGHSGIDHVHITGAAATFDAIVWGTGPQGARRRRERRPLLRKPITAELGGVSPIIVVPGAWTDADLRYHAEHVATMRLHNSGHNCIAGQVVILSADWAQRDAFLAELRRAYAAAPSRPVWYPRADEKLAAAATSYPDADWFANECRAIVEVPAGAPQSPVETTEYFAPILGVVELAGEGQVFFAAAVAHANERLTGTLGANVLIDPATMAALGEGFEKAVADLRYGAVAINAWSAFAFLNATLTWGAFPGATVDHVESGLGIVHNALLLDRVERSVVRGPFRPFPRSTSALTGRGTFSVLPKPPWFVTSRTGAVVSEGFTRFRVDGNWARLSKTLLQAFRA